MAPYLLDTNILLRLIEPAGSGHALVRKAVETLGARGDDLYYPSQTLAEFWKVCTRPAEKNGYGLSIEETNRRTALIESRFLFLADSRETHEQWRKIVVEHEVSGVQVHDARLVAAMLVHGVGHLVTLNDGDFRRYSGISVVRPERV